MTTTTSIHETCPICQRNRRDVASVSGGTQAAIGKRTTCVECGTKVLERRDARAQYRWQYHPPDELGQAHRRPIREIDQLNRTIAPKKMELAELNDRLRRQGFIRRLLGVFTKR